MKHKLTITFLAIVIGLLLVGTVSLNNSIELKEENIKIIENENGDLYEELAESNSKLAKYESITNTINNIDLLSEHDYEYTYHYVDLTVPQQRFIQDLCFQYDFSYELILGIIYAESRFKLDAVSYNNTSLGIMQVNKNYSDSFANIIGLEEYDLFDFEDNIILAFANLIYSREYWMNQGYANEVDLTMLILASYNRGIGGTIKYIKNNGTSETNYAYNVLSYKFDLEMGLIN